MLKHPYNVVHMHSCLFSISKDKMDFSDTSTCWLQSWLRKVDQLEQNNSAGKESMWLHLCVFKQNVCEEQLVGVISTYCSLLG